MKKPVRMVNLQVSGDALGTEPSFVNRKIITWLEADHMILFDQQIDAALHTAVRAMRWYHLVYYAVGQPAFEGCIV